MITVLALLVAVDPVGLARVWPGRLVLALYVGAALGAAVGLAEPVLGLLDLSPEGFWIAAGLVLLVPAFGRLGWGATRDVAGPGGVLVAMALATRDGVDVSLLAVGTVVVGVVVAMRFVKGESALVRAVERVVGALMVVVAFDLIRDGVIAV
jgi:small neutral amino acid transporter SnatA (MarC family)